MRTNVKKIINFRFDRYEEVEAKLKKLAAKGLLLETCGPFAWTFRKAEPQDLNYTVTYFSEASIFNPERTDNQQTYLDYAQAAGWSFVTEWNQMQIFSSKADNPVPFETDEGEKLQNIKKCMKKSFLPSIFLLILVFSLNLVLQFSSFSSDPIDFLSNASRLLSGLMLASVVLYCVYSVLDYFIWCNRSRRAIADGGGCIARNGFRCRLVDGLFLCFVFGLLACSMLSMASALSWFGIVLCVAQVPILILLYGSSIQYLKKKRASAMVNRVLSMGLLTVATFAYLACVTWILIRFGFSPVGASAYRTVAWPVTPTTTHEYRLYHDELPLTCEDLYGAIQYDYYSWEKKVDATVFLTKSTYRQDSLPAKDAPPRLEYEVLETRFAFVSRLAREQLLTIPEWRSDVTFHALDNEIFGTEEAYQSFYDDAPTGKYLLFFEDKLITLQLDAPATRAQIATIREKLL